MIITKLELASKVIGVSEIKGKVKKPYYFFDVPPKFQLTFLNSSSKTMYTNWFK